LEGEHSPGGDVGHDQGVSMLLAHQRSRSVSVQVQGAQADGTHLNRKPNTASTPTPTAAGENASQRSVAGAARSGSRTGRCSS
jgi:hypothetical protein